MLKKSLLLGLGVALSAILLATSSMGRWLEEEVGLIWLFQLRGPQPAPVDVVVVSIDQYSSQRLGLTNKPRKWPRSLHADLVRKLTNHGAAVIVFDIIFEETREPEDNQLFAEAIHAANNVILFQYLKQESVHILGPNGREQQSGYIETLTPPIPVLKKAALGIAPFTLPKVPASINHFNSFKPELGDLPTLPTAALQVYGIPVYMALRSLLKAQIPEQITHLPTTLLQLQMQGEIQKVAQQLRRLFLDNPGLDRLMLTRLNNSPTPFSPDQRRLLDALISSYAQPHVLYLNFYGPPQTIRTIPYYKVLESTDNVDSLDLGGKAVFIGFSDPFQPEQKDGFYTAFSQKQSGLDISGVEIAATAFANLLQRKIISVSSATLDITIFITWGILLGVVLRVLSGPILIPAALILGLAYHLLSYFLFKQENHWIPLAIPLLWQTPLALIGALLWNYLDAHRERRNIRHAFGHHLPIKIVDQLAKGFEPITTTEKHVHSIVLATDAQQYTRLSEQIAPAQLHELMNRYYETLFEPIRKSGGIISDVVGDATLAIWTSDQSNTEQRRMACQAALNILAGVEKFNQCESNYALPTRLGLHFGELVMGHVGAMDHYEYRAVGDIVNTASRIESLNKQLGTHILVSKEVLDGVEGFIIRELGSFLLLGKSKPLSLYELVAKDDQNKLIKPFTDFVNALHFFQAQQWNEAGKLLENFILDYGEDGPSRYYLDLCTLYLKYPPTEWDGIIRLINK